MEKKSSVTEIVIDAEGAVLGRMATYAAKQSLLGNKVTVVNCEKAIITGNKRALQEVYLNKRKRGGTSQKGPYFSKLPDRIVRRTIRGMLPWKNTAGKEAFKRVMCYVGVPDSYAGKEKVSFKTEINSPHMTIGEISVYI